MRIRITVAGLLLAMLGIVGIPQAPAQQGDGTIVSSASVEVATDVINGTVLAIQSVDTGNEVHSLALVRVDEAVEGNLSGDVFVEVPGGTSAGGLQVTVSHQPSFRVSDVVQLALLRATAEEESVLTGGASPVYSVVGGIDGAAAVSGSLLSQANASGDFTLTGTKWDPRDSSRWPIPYRINTANSGLSAANTVAALRAGVEDWVADSGTDIEFNYLGTTAASPSNYNDGTNTVGWVTTGAADQFLAQAVWVSSSGTTLAFDVRFNRDYQWAWGAQSGHFDVETVQLHEIGHVLGLGHTTASTAEVMYPSISSNRTKGLGAGDLSGVAGLYPAANPPVPEPPCVEALRPDELGSMPLNTGSGYVAIEPVRVLDSRPASQVGEYSTPWCPGENRAVRVAGVAGVPADAPAVAIHVTSVAPTGDGSYLSIKATGQAAAGLAAVKNFGTGSDVASITNDLVIAQVGANGMIDVYNAAGTVDLVVDVVGYFSVTGGDRFVALTPDRILDSRTGLGGEKRAWGPGETRRVNFAGTGGVPAVGASAVAVHVTSVSPSAAGSYLQATPSGSAPSLSAAKNFGAAGDHTGLANDLLFLKLGPDGAVDFYNAAGTVDLVMDVVGYFSPTEGASYVATAPVRVLDTRIGIGGSDVPWGHGESRIVMLEGSAGIPAGVSAAAVHVTSVSPSANSYLAVEVPGALGTTTAAKNFGNSAGHTAITNDLMIVPVDANGRVTFFNNTGSVDLVVDVVGYFFS